MLQHTPSLASLACDGCAASLPGTWKLGAGRAVTLQPAEDGLMRVSHGRIWATYDGPHRGALNDFGDYVVGAGDRLWVRAGQRLVIQSWERQSPAYFSWDPVVQTRPVREISFAPVMQPLADLRLALSIGLRASGKLASGIARIARDCVMPRRSGACVNGA
ncbi:MAG TPA: DUF2917 domain-containing protein [Ramlibacter sp.]|uniref:DUF2917 domain-containing protein n=1 Tax=Ramlibacter sp. TaxID=1917967 RepID=UPI002C2BE6D6|nr:DUF2917 domain-containing protein [Ramlibacter sp.]HVZ42360.1 DUF2917 domain-containing protein [Ramlibacter sp.]